MDQVDFLRGLPVPVLGEVRGGAGAVGDGGAAIGEEAVGYFGADVQGEDGEEGVLGTGGDACGVVGKVEVMICSTL